MPGAVENYGFLQAIAEMSFWRDYAITGFDNPTRVIVLAHSHGTVWAHATMFLLPDLPVDILIDLDGVSWAWESEELLSGDRWGEIIEAYNDLNDIEWSFEFWHAADNWQVDGLPSQDIEDIAPPSAWLNIEVIANSIYPGPWDDWTNHRTNGTTDGIWTFHSERSHGGVTQPDSDAMIWIGQQMESLYTW